jgi:hypothetical protein
VIPKSKTESRIKANLEGDFKLDQEDVEKIAQLDKKLRFNVSTAKAEPHVMSVSHRGRCSLKRSPCVLRTPLMIIIIPPSTRMTIS